MQPVGALHRGQAHIRQHKPLRGTGIIIKRDPLDPRRERINPGVLIGQHLAQRQAGCHGLVKLVLHLAHTFPDLLGHII